MLDLLTLLAGLMLAGAPPAPSGASQPTPSRASVPATDAPGVDVGFEIRRDRYRYRFESPSSFNTSFSVPHYFEQSYRVDGRWLVVRGRYRVLRRLWKTEVGLTADKVGYGDDYDTFFNPNDNIIVYGTRAEAAIRSWRIRQSVALARVAGFDTWIGYSFRRDRAVFPASDSTTTQSNPPSFSSFWNAGRETTISDVHEVKLGAGRTGRLSDTWQIGGRVEVTPFGVARLTTNLPDKYPGQPPIVFVARGPSLASMLEARWRIGRLRLAVSADYAHSWSYGSVNQFHRDLAGIRVTAGYQP